MDLKDYVGMDSRNQKDPISGLFLTKQYLKYRFPRPKGSSPGLKFLGKSGFNKPRTHLRWYYEKDLSGAEQDMVLYEHFKQPRESVRSKGGTI